MKTRILALGLLVALFSCSGRARAENWQELIAAADSLQKQHNYDSAISIAKLALPVAEAELGQEDTAVARILENLAVWHLSLRMYSEAEPFGLRALKIRESVLGSENADVVRSLQYLGATYYGQHRLAEAASYFERAVLIEEKLENAPLARSLSSLAVVRRLQGRLNEADSLYKRAVTVARRRDLDGVSLAICVANSAVLSQMLGRSDEAEEGFLEALAIKQRVLGPDHWSVASSMNHLGSFYREMGRYQESEHYHLQALALEKRIFSPGYPSIAQTQHYLAELYRDQGRYAEAESALSRAIDIWERAYGPRHYLVAMALESMCHLKRVEGSPSAALKFAERAARLRLRHVSEHIVLMPEYDALNASQEMRKSVGRYLTCFFELASPDDATKERTADLIVAGKGAVSDGMFWRGRALVEESDTRDAELAARLNSSKLRLSRLFVAGPGPNLDGHRRVVDSLEQATLLMESELFRTSASFRSRRALSDVSAEKLMSLLPGNAALIEYLRYDHQPIDADSTIAHYLALVLVKDARPAIVNLGSVSKVDSLVGKYRDHLLFVSTTGSTATTADLAEYSEISSALYKKIWKPLEEYIDRKELLLIAPDGALNIISFAGLANGDHTYLIETHSIHYLSSGRDLVRLSNSRAAGSGLFALGDPDYEASIADRLSGLRKLDDNVSGACDRAKQLVRGNGNGLNELALSALPGTREEIQKIVSAWREYSNEPAVVCVGSAASEDNFKLKAPGSRIIHLATHGYFIGDIGARNITENGFDSEAIWLGDNPLLHSGLFFAGANCSEVNAVGAGVDDGVLTAYEVSALDLAGTELVVLSACETGLGEIQSGEGVYGLRRAFQMAGAETVISMLWPVSDRMMAEIASQLYGGKGELLPETIRRIQLEKIHELRWHGKCDHPVSWGALVAYGNWR